MQICNSVRMYTPPKILNGETSFCSGAMTSARRTTCAAAAAGCLGVTVFPQPVGNPIPLVTRGMRNPDWEQFSGTFQLTAFLGATTSIQREECESELQVAWHMRVDWFILI